MKTKALAILLPLLAVAQSTWAVAPLGVPTGTSVGESLSAVLGVDLAVAAGGALPVGIGGMAAITALSLVIGVQLVKRQRNKK